MTTHRLRPISPAQRRRILMRDNHTCVYCFELATECDHIIPYSYIPDNTDANLVASCRLCNAIAGSMVFDSFNMKYQYIKREREKRVRPYNPAWYMRAVRAMMDETPKPEKVKAVKPPKPKVIKPKRVKPKDTYDPADLINTLKPKRRVKRIKYPDTVSREFRAMMDKRYEEWVEEIGLSRFPEQKAAFDYWQDNRRRPVRDE